MSIEKRKVYLEEADRPPPSYYKTEEEPFTKKLPFQTPDPQQWLKAPEFVPRSRLNDAFAPSTAQESDYSQGIENEQPVQHVPYMPMTSNAFHHRDLPDIPFPFMPPFGGGFVPGVAPFPMMPMAPPMGHMTQHGGPLPPNMPPFVPPNGYSANITNINPGGGPPIPAIVLRKKRRKRGKAHSMISCSESPSESHTNEDSKKTDEEMSPSVEPEDKEGFRPHCLTSIGGSCPDLTEEKMVVWDNYLYEAALETERREIEEEARRRDRKDRDNDVMQTSAYELVPQSLLDVAEEHLHGSSNREIRRIEREINGNSMTSSMIMQKLKTDKRPVDSDGSTQHSLAAEMEELAFRPPLTKYGYPQLDASRVQLATYHKDGVRSHVMETSLHDEDERYEEDFFDKITITNNLFDNGEELSLDDIENPEGNRFHQIHKALTSNSRRYSQLKAPERVCCSTM